MLRGEGHDPEHQRFLNRRLEQQIRAQQSHLPPLWLQLVKLWILLGVGRRLLRNVLKERFLRH
jgi:hypothetical protein